jgi:endonuclease G
MAARRDGADEEANLGPLINLAINLFCRLSVLQQIAVAAFLLIAGVVWWDYFNHHLAGSVPISGGAAANLLLGNPSNATPDGFNRDNYLMVKPYYALSYNDTKGTPNWVSWRVIESDLGQAPRKDEFDEDFELPAGFSRVLSHDYSGSGFDRGHMCPHSDRAANQEMSFSTFVMTNIIPQAPNVNRKAWAQEEDYCRELVRHHDRLYIVAGPVGQGGRGSQGERRTIGQGRVVVPSGCWKVVVDVPDTGSDDVNQITSDTRVLTVEMPNDNDVVNDEWAQYRTTPAQIELQTGLHFFTGLSPEVARVLREKMDRVELPAPRPLGY